MTDQAKSAGSARQPKDWKAIQKQVQSLAVKAQQIQAQKDKG
jgi:hypothetical protein